MSRGGAPPQQPPYTDEHPAADAGKTIHYLLRWQNAKGDTGPWSDVITARIPS